MRWGRATDHEPTPRSSCHAEPYKIDMTGCLIFVFMQIATDADGPARFRHRIQRPFRVEILAIARSGPPRPATTIARGAAALPAELSRSRCLVEVGLPQALPVVSNSPLNVGLSGHCA